MGEPSEASEPHDQIFTAESSNTVAPQRAEQRMQTSPSMWPWVFFGLALAMAGLLLALVAYIVLPAN
jgi:hypothetical protein